MTAALETATVGLRILFVTPRYLPEMGGVERHVAEVARRLVHRGCAVTVLTTDRSGALPERERVDGVDVRRVRAYPRGGDLHFAPALKRAIAAGSFDLVHLQSYHTLVAPMAMRAARAAGLPYVVTFHGGGHSSRLRHLARPLQRRALRPLLAGARRLVAVARFEVEHYGRELGLGPERFVVIPNGAELPAPPASRAAESPVDRGTLIASVGRLERYKGHHRAIAALPHVLREQPDARLWIAGSGPYEAPLRKLAARLGVADRVEIRAVPADEPARLAQELSRTSLVVLLSEFETHPIAALEARSLGRPLLVADGSGLSELAESGQARSVAHKAPPQRVASAMLESLRSPLAAPPLRPFTWEDCAAGLHALYGEVVWEARCAS